MRESKDKCSSFPCILSTFEISLITLPVEFTSISLCPALPTSNGLKDFSNPSFPISRSGILEINGKESSF